jgi:hypothetical protein
MNLLAGFAVAKAVGASAKLLPRQQHIAAGSTGSAWRRPPTRKESFFETLQKCSSRLFENLLFFGWKAVISGLA